MDENNRTPHPSAPSEGNKTNKNRNHRRGGHRGNKNDNKQRREPIVPPSVDTGAPTPSSSVVNSEKGRNPNTPQKNSLDAKKNDARFKKLIHQKHARRPQEQFTTTDDRYGDPKAEKELAEWRSKIVLNAAETAPADEPSVPTVTLEQTTDEEPIKEQIEVVGIQFRSAGKLYYFDPQGIHLKPGDFAIVETARGAEFGDVCMENTMIASDKIVLPLRPILRAATTDDIAHNDENRTKETEAMEICRQKIAQHRLDMKLIDAQYAFDNSKLLFYFASEGRVDFRELVKDLASVFRTRIELRQIGIRDEAKMLGGLGACGRKLCCSTFLPDFAQVSIKMAKEQGLSLNSTKISGLCGRLMCCLRFESDVYTEEIRLTPAFNSTVKTEDGIGTVIGTNPLAGTVRVVLKNAPDAPPKQYHRDDVTVLTREKQVSDASESENPD